MVSTQLDQNNVTSYLHAAVAVNTAWVAETYIHANIFKYQYKMLPDVKSINILRQIMTLFFGGMCTS